MTREAETTSQMRRRPLWKLRDCLPYCFSLSSIDGKDQFRLVPADILFLFLPAASPSTLPSSLSIAPKSSRSVSLRTGSALSADPSTQPHLFSPRTFKTTRLDLFPASAILQRLLDCCTAFSCLQWPSLFPCAAQSYRVGLTRS